MNDTLNQVMQSNKGSKNTLTVQDVASLMSQYNYRFINEEELQRAIAQVLEDAGIEVERERPISARDRLDLWLPDSGIAIEIKIAGHFPRLCARWNATWNWMRSVELF